MQESTQIYDIKLISKIGLGMANLLTGLLILYGVYTDISVGEFWKAGLAFVVAVAWTLVMLAAANVHIRLTEDALVQKRLFVPKLRIPFSDIETIHFGKTHSPTHVLGNDTKISISSHFNAHEDLVDRTVMTTKATTNFENIELKGKQETINKYRS
jgi:hypothetical protein